MDLVDQDIADGSAQAERLAAASPVKTALRDTLGGDIVAWVTRYPVFLQRFSRRLRGARPWLN
ncbi:hypothetical protein [Pelagimonas varians]|uniref:hypothetical protein n=1 Tax=Pelagimonas varians TaxID=696760 RepID=UPI000BEF13A9|nr:hypothetical protein [Pelagimonas varians]